MTSNHDLKLLRKMFNWGIRKGYLKRTPFKVESVNTISLDREIPRQWRFDSEEDEQKLLDAANPHLRAVLIALLDTAARPGRDSVPPVEGPESRTTGAGDSCGKIEDSDSAHRADFHSTPRNSGDAEVGPGGGAIST